MEHYWERITLWGSWALFGLLAAAYARLWHSASAQQLRRMEQALEEGVKQLEEKGEYIDSLEGEKQELRRDRNERDIAIRRLETQAAVVESDRRKLMRALETARLANARLVTAMGEAAQAQKKAEEKLEMLDTRVIQLEAQLGMR